MAFSSPVCYQNWYWLYQTPRGAFPATVQFIFSHLWLFIQYCKIPVSETTQVCMLLSIWKWIHIPSACICSIHCCAETPLSPIAITPLGLLSLPRDHKPQHYWSANAQCWLGWEFAQSVQLMFLYSLSEIHITFCLGSAARSQRTARSCELHHSWELSSQAMFW